MVDSASSSPSLSVIIPSKDRAQILKNHINYLIEATKHIAAEIIIVNDSAKDLQPYPQDDYIRIVKNPKSGVASARNYGAQLALAPILLFLDDDMIVFRANIDAILAFHDNHRDSFLNLNWSYPPDVNKHLKNTPFGRYLNQHQFNALKGWNKDNPDWKDACLFKTTGITSQNLSVAKSTFINSGGYNENFPYAGFEDHEYSQRIVAAGYKIYIDSSQMTYHNESDRLNLPNWLKRKYRGGITRRVAVNFGFIDYKLSAGVFKRIAIFIIAPFMVPIAKLTSYLLRSKSFDKLFFKSTNILLAFAIYGGYFSKEASKYIDAIDEP